jgi:hypothetical protein
MGTLCSRACGSFVIVFPLVGQLYLIIMDHYVYAQEVSLPHSAVHRRKRFRRARTGADANIGNRSVLTYVE